MKPTRLQSYLLVFVFALCLSANAQIDREIRSYVDSTELLLNNGRKLLMSNLTTENHDKAQEVYTYLQNTAAGERCLAFSYTDILYITAASHQWKEWIDYAKNYNEKVALPVYKSNHSISNELYYIINQKSSKILNALQSSSISNEDKAMIELFVHVVSHDDLNNEYKQLYTNFEEQHPSNKYSEILSDYLPAPKTKIAVAWDTGITTVYPSGSLGENFHIAGLFHMAMDYNIGDAYVSTFFNFGYLELKHDLNIPELGELEMSDRFNYCDAGMKFGYFLNRSELFHFAPYVTLGGASMAPFSYSIEFETINAFTYGVGIHTEVKLSEHKHNLYYIYGLPYYMTNPNLIKQHFALKLDIGYNMFATHRYDEFKGSMVCAQMGLVWGFGDF